MRKAGATRCILGLIRLYYRLPHGGRDPQPEGGGPGLCGEKERHDYKRIFKPNEVSKRAVITSKPEPGYTEKARLKGIQGVVRLRVVFSADGMVQHITVTKRLPDGLTEQAVEAAQKIRFTPAEMDGRKVSQSAVIEYRFDL